MHKAGMRVCVVQILIFLQFLLPGCLANAFYGADTFATLPAVAASAALVPGKRIRLDCCCRIVSEVLETLGDNCRGGGANRFRQLHRSKAHAYKCHDR